MKKIIFIAVFLISAGNCFAQQVTFQKIYEGIGSYSHCVVQQTADSGYILSGETYIFGSGGQDVYLMKTDANGDSLWTKTFGGTYDDQAWCIKQTSDSGYIIIGFTFFGGPAMNAYLIKTDPAGNLLWSKTFGGASTDDGYSVEQTADGGYIIVGYTFSFGAGNFDVYLIRTDDNGNLLWSKTYGGVNNDRGFSVQQTIDGGYIVTGLTHSFGLSSENVLLIKTDSIGNLLWAKTFGGSDDEEGFSIQQSTDGGYIVAGATRSFGLGNWDVYLIKTDSIGNLLWSKTFGVAGADAGYSIQHTADGGYIIGGYSLNSSDVYLLKIGVNGNVIWSKNFGGTGIEWGNSVQQTMDGGYVISGITDGFGSGSWKGYLIKTDSLGNSGCYDVNPATIVAIPATQVTNPSTIVTSPPTIVTTPATIVGSGGTVTTLCTTVGISPTPSTSGGEGVAIAPNPATNNFTITFPNTINKGSIEIYNVLGKKIFTEKISHVSEKEIYFKNIDAGIYFVKVRDGEKEYCEKLMIE